MLLRRGVRMSNTARLRFIVALLLIVTGLSGIFLFDTILNRLKFLSGDGIINPHTLLQLKVLLISCGIVGLVLLFKKALIRFLGKKFEIVISANRKKFLWYTLGIAVILRISALAMPFHLWGDWMTYHELAQSWSANGSYSVNGIPYAYRPPGYPFFITIIYMIFGAVPRLAAAFNVIFGTMSVWLTYLIVQNIWNNRKARIAAIIMALFPSQILFTNKLATEPLFTMLLLTGVYLVLKASESKDYVFSIASGFTLGISALVRAVVQGFIAVPALFYMLAQNHRSYKTRNIVFLLISFALVVAPWMYRNYEAKGSFTLATQTGINLLIGNAPGSGMGWNQAVTEQFDVNDPANQVYVDSAARAMAIEYIKDDPVGFIKRGFLKLGYFFSVDMEGVWNEMIDAAGAGRLDGFVVIAIAAESYYLIVLFLSVTGFYLFIRHKKLRRTGGYLLLGTILYWAAVHFVFFGDGRFHYPIVPMIVAFASLYFDYQFENKARE